MSELTKKQRVINYINLHGSITQLEANEKIGASRLGAIMWDLANKDGYNIKKETVKVKDRWGDNCYVTRYSFMEEQDKMIEENMNHIPVLD